MLTGIVFAGDTACSSAAHSLHDAIADITAGRTDYAIVLGSCHILAPNMTLAFHRLHMLSPEGACKAFDAAGNGYAEISCPAFELSRKVLIHMAIILMLRARLSHLIMPASFHK